MLKWQFSTLLATELRSVLQPEYFFFVRKTDELLKNEQNLDVSLTEEFFPSLGKTKIGPSSMATGSQTVTALMTD